MNENAMKFDPFKRIEESSGTIIIKGLAGTGKSILASQLARIGGEMLFVSSRPEELELRRFLDTPEAEGMERGEMRRHYDASRAFARALGPAKKEHHMLDRAVKEFVDEYGGGSIVVDSLTGFSHWLAIPEHRILHAFQHALDSTSNSTTERRKIIATVESETGSTGDVCDHLADSIIKLERTPNCCQQIRRAVFQKSSGTCCPESEIFTIVDEHIEYGLEYEPKVVIRSERWKETRTKEGFLSSSSKDLDGFFDGGFAYGSFSLFIADSKVPLEAMRDILAPLAANAFAVGMGVTMMLPASLHSSEVRRNFTKVIDKRVVDERMRVFDIETEGLENGYSERPHEYSVQIPAIPDLEHDFSVWKNAVAMLRERSGAKLLKLFSLDMLETRYSRKLDALNHQLVVAIDFAKRIGDILVGFGRKGQELEDKLTWLADRVYRLRSIDDIVSLYGERPRTCQYAIKRDDSLPISSLKLIPLG